MKRTAAVATLVVLAAAARAEAVAFTLTERQIADAVEVGERSVTRDDVGPEWHVKNGAGHALTVMTPFHRLAIAARHAAFRNEPLKARDRRSALKEQEDRLLFWVELKGRRADFAQFYAPRLLAGAREVLPSFAQNERTAARAEDGSFVAKCTYGFPVKQISGTGKVVLVIRDEDGRNVTSFTVDLASMR